MATLAIRWLKIPRVGYFDDFGSVATDTAVRGAMGFFAYVNEILGAEPKAKKS